MMSVCLHESACGVPWWGVESGLLALKVAILGDSLSGGWMRHSERKLLATLQPFVGETGRPVQFAEVGPKYNYVADGKGL